MVWCFPFLFLSPPLSSRGQSYENGLRNEQTIKRKESGVEKGCRMQNSMVAFVSPARKTRAE
jgi:hypothetical protein